MVRRYLAFVDTERAVRCRIDLEKLTSPHPLWEHNDLPLSAFHLFPIKNSSDGLRDDFNTQRYKQQVKQLSSDPAYKRLILIDLCYKPVNDVH